MCLFVHVQISKELTEAVCAAHFCMVKGEDYDNLHITCI